MAVVLVALGVFWGCSQVVEQQTDPLPTDGATETPVAPVEDTVDSMKPVLSESSYITSEELFALLENSTEVAVIDIRSRANYNLYNIEGSKNIPAGNQFIARMDEVPRTGLIVLVTTGEDRIAETYELLMEANYDQDSVRVLRGGIDAWSVAGYPLVTDLRVGC